MEQQLVLYEKKDGIATITLNRPEVLNAINYALVRDVVTAIEDCRISQDVRVVVIKGAGRAFCAGDDIKYRDDPFGPPNMLQTRMKEHYVRLIKDLLDLPKPVIAAIHGYALGGGCDIAMACDMRVAAEDAQLGVVFVLRGLGGGGTYLLPKMVGLGKARELLYLGDTVDGKEAERIGLVNYAVPADRLDGKVQELADRFAKGPTRSIGLIKTAVNHGLGVGITQGMEYQAYANLCLNFVEDSQEGRAAFREKREPHFKGV